MLLHLKNILVKMKRETFDMNALKKKISDMEHSHSEGECCAGDHDYMDDLPLLIRRRVHALKSLHSMRSSISAEFRSELLQLERKYLAKYAPLNEERAKIVNGEREPNDQELKDFKESGVEEVGQTGTPVDTLKGIPNFWLTVLQNHPSIRATIAEEDTEVLSTLRDIRVCYFPDKPGFKLDFEFGPNDFFSNSILSKEYHLDNPEEGEQDDFVYDHAVGTEILWKNGKNLCFKTVVRTQRHRTNNSTRTVKREEPLDSFFHFFIPPLMPNDEEVESEDIDELENRLQMDYEIGELIKEQIVPNAVDWFTGKALEYAELEDEDDYFGEEGYDEEDEDNEDEEEESDDEAPRNPSKPGMRHRDTSNTQTNQAAAGEKPECKQQ